MSAEVDVEAAEWITKHEELGFHLIESAPRTTGVRVGARVRNRGELYPSAHEDGTAVVLAVMRRGTDENPDSWERSYGRPNVEVIVRHDRGHVTAWADYGTYLAENQPEDARS